MSDYLAAQKTLSFSYDSNLQVVTSSDQKLGLSSSGTVNLSRPDRVHTTRSGGFVDTETLFDGKTLTLLGKNVNKYTQVEMHGTVDQLIDELKDKHGLPLPAADLLMTNSYEELMKGVYDSKDLGSGFVNGKECDSLAFRKDDVDFQIWVAQGDQPYPCRLVITSSKVKGGPEYSIQIRDWKTGDGVPADDFAFKNTTNAEKADVKDLKQNLSEMPDNFVVGDKNELLQTHWNHLARFGRCALHWRPDGRSAEYSAPQLRLSAIARVGRPLTPVSVAGVARRTTRRCAAGVYYC